MKKAARPPAPDASIVNFSVILVTASMKVGNVMEKMIAKMARMRKDAVSINFVVSDVALYSLLLQHCQFHINNHVNERF